MLIIKSINEEKDKMRRSQRLIVLENLFKSAEQQGEYGGKGPFELPDEHKAAMQVTKGGSSCSNCKWVDAEKNECKSDYYIKWNGGDPKIPMPLDEFCSDWWQAK